MPTYQETINQTMKLERRYYVVCMYTYTHMHAHIHAHITGGREERINQTKTILCSMYVYMYTHQDNDDGDDSEEENSEDVCM